MPTGDIHFCVFETYGTLLYVHSAEAKHSRDLGPDAIDVDKLWRAKQLEYSWVHSLMERHLDFWILTGLTLDYSLEHHGISSENLRDQLLDSYLSLNAYLEVPAFLKALKKAEFRVAILSNGSPFVLNSAAKSTGLSGAIETSFSLEDLGANKLSPIAYRHAIEKLKVDSGNVAIFSSNAWAAAGASAFGLASHWVNRTRQPNEYGLRSGVVELQSLSEFEIDAHSNARSGS